MSLGFQLLLLQVCIVLLTLTVAGTLAVRLQQQQHDHHQHQRLTLRQALARLDGLQERRVEDQLRRADVLQGWVQRRGYDYGLV